MARLFATPARQPGLGEELRAAMREEDGQEEEQATTGEGTVSTARRDTNPEPEATLQPTLWEVVFDNPVSPDTNRDDDENEDDDSDEPATKGQLRRLRKRVIETREALIAQHEVFCNLERSVRGLLLGGIIQEVKEDLGRTKLQITELAATHESRLEDLEYKLEGLDDWAHEMVREVTDQNLSQQVEDMRRRLDKLERKGGAGYGGGGEPSVHGGRHTSSFQTTSWS